MPLTQLYQQVKDGVVQVLALNGQTPVSFGSGSVINSGKIVLTCAHCVIPGTQMAIADPITPGRALFGNVLFSDAQTDIALLEFPKVVGSPVKMANSNTCSVGNGAFVIGFPMGVTEQTLFSAHIASITASGLRIDASVNHGNSGGPLFNMQGEQIGVINAKHGSLSQFLTQIKNAKPMAMMSIGGIDPVKAIQVLVEEMQKNLNLGIGYVIKRDVAQNHQFKYLLVFEIVVNRGHATPGQIRQPRDSSPCNDSRDRRAQHIFRGWRPGEFPVPNEGSELKHRYSNFSLGLHEKPLLMLSST